MTKKDSQIIMMQHSEAKIELLKRYLERYLNIMSLTPHVNTIYLIDVFCGEGIYEKEGIGSPVAILHSLNEIINKRKLDSTHFYCRFNDSDRAKVNKLQKIINDKTLDEAKEIDLQIYNEDYKEFISRVFQRVNILKSNERAFVFIDPYGYKEITIKDIQNLLKNGKTEVLLFLPTQFMFRFEKKATPESLKKFIEEIVPREEWPINKTGLQFIENLLQGLRKAIGRKHFVDSFILERDRNQFFCLFFFTSHIYGFDRMLDVKWSIDEEDGRGWKLETENLFSSFKAPNVGKFEEQLKHFLQQERNNLEIYEFTLRNGHIPKHAVDIISKLQNQNLVDIKSTEGKNIRKGSYFINWENFKKKTPKLKFKIKNGTIIN